MAADSLSVDDLGAFLVQPAPRLVPANISVAGRKRIASNARSMGCIGWVFLLLGFVAIYFFFPRNFGSEMQLWLGDTATVRGTNISSSALSVKINNRNVYRFNFRYTPISGKTLTGVCYATGSSIPSRTVIYLKSKPTIARYENSTLDPMGSLGLLVLLLPVIGLLIARSAWRTRRRVQCLLREGVFATGKVTAVDTTNMTVNNQRRYKITITFATNGNPQTQSYNAYGADVNRARRKMEVAETIGILHRANDPKHFLLVHSLLGE